MNKPERQGTGFPLKLDQVKALSPRRLAVQAAGAGAGASDPRSMPPPKSARAKAVGELLSGPVDPAMVRRRMVDRLRAGGIKDEQVLAAMARVPRHVFVDSALMAQAYEDTSLPIGLSQTISKPSVVARMVELLRRQQGHAVMGKVLEIGTGCGYQAAVLAEMSRQVFSVERLRALHDKARHNLQELRRDNLRLIFGDGMLGHPPNAPYDAIIAAASGESVPQAWLDQLAPGGRLVAPTQHGAKGQQVILVIDRRLDGTLTRSVHEAVRFVPLKSGVL